MIELWDVHTHVGLDIGFFLRGWSPYASTALDLLQRMDENGLRRAVCFPFTLPSAFAPDAFAERGEVRLLEGRFPFDIENRLLGEEIARIDTNRRLLRFAMFDPSRKVEAQIASIEKIIGTISGLKTQTTVLQSPIRDLLTCGRALMDLAQQHDLPVLFHTSINPADTWAQVSDCLDVAASFPKVRFNLAHSLRLHAPLLRRARELPNVWIDCSAHLNHCALARADSPAVASVGERVDANYHDPVAALLAVHAIVGDRYLWGSDNPYMSWCDDTLRLLHSYKAEADVLHALPEEVKRSMAHDAPRAWLFGDKQEKS